MGVKSVQEVRAIVFDGTSLANQRLSKRMMTTNQEFVSSVESLKKFQAGHAV